MPGCWRSHSRQGLFYRIEIQLLLTDSTHIEGHLVVGNSVDEVSSLEARRQDTVEAIDR